MKFHLAEFTPKKHIERLEVQSFEMNVYLVKVTITGETGFVYDAKDKIARFHSTQHIREFFHQCIVDDACMVHDSPYDEMIGNPPKTQQPLAMPFSLEQPY